MGSSLRAEPAPAAKVRLGIVDIRKVFSQSRAGRDAKDRLKEDFDKKQRKLDADQEDLRKLVMRGASETDPSKRDAITRQVEQRTKALQELYERYQRELEQAEKAASAKLMKDVRALIPALTAQLGLIGVAEAEGVYFTQQGVERVDVTQEVAKRLDAVTPPAAKAQGEPPTGPSVPQKVPGQTPGQKEGTKPDGKAEKPTQPPAKQPPKPATR